jgi:hypothetical protein
MKFFDDRMEVIQKLPDYTKLPTGGRYIPHEDNGC